ncbi:MAG: glucose-6-phosphate isomerase [bacterium]
MTAIETLIQHFENIKDIRLVDLFAEDPRRADMLTVSGGGLTLDISKNLLLPETVDLLCDWAAERNLYDGITQLFDGENLNVTEQRPAVHPLIRNFAIDHPISRHAEAAFRKMADYAGKFREGKILGATGMALTDVVNIGIGGSDLGPRLVVDALKSVHQPQHPNVHFVSNVDPHDFYKTVQFLNPETTLFIVASKSFGTQETFANFELAQQWLAGAGIGDWTDHALAVTANPEKAVAAGFSGERIFAFDEGVGGRYSLWSTVGLPIMLALGEAEFAELLDGAAAMDQHFQTAPLEQNLPVLLALVYAWYRNFHGCESHAVLPYADGLAFFPSYLQQLEMESLGKSVSLNNSEVDEDTGGVIWGQAGTNGQHSFYQLLHQGTNWIPTDFVAVMKPMVTDSEKGLSEEGHRMLLANCIAQSRALMTGDSEEAVYQRQIDAGSDENQARLRARHGTLPGNRPSTTIVLDELNAQRLGALIALYEHKVFVLSRLWDINPFDQWGVECGKQIGKQVLRALSSEDVFTELDSSSRRLVERYQNQNNLKN